METVWERAIKILSDADLKAVLTGKVSPVIKTQNEVKLDKDSITEAGKWIVGGLIGSAIVSGLIIGLFIRWSIKGIKSL